MSRIVVLAFEDETAADAFRGTLQGLVDDGALEVEDAVKVVVQEDGTAVYDHYHSVIRGGAVVGGILGGLVGLMVLNPVAGAAVGAAGGAAIGKLTGDYGLEEAFIAETTAALQPGTVALFLQAKRVDDREAVVAAVEAAGATVITTRVNREAEEFHAALEQPDPE